MQKLFRIALMAVALMLPLGLMSQGVNVFDYSKDEQQYLLWMYYTHSCVIKNPVAIFNGNKSIYEWRSSELAHMTELQLKLAARKHAIKKQTQKKIRALKQEMRSSIIFEKDFVSLLQPIES